MINCFVIDPTAKTIAAVTFNGDLDSIRQLIGFETIDSDEIDANGDLLFFDEKCFIRQVPGNCCLTKSDSYFQNKEWLNTYAFDQFRPYIHRPQRD